MANYTLTLKDDIDSVSFIDDSTSTYFLLDGTLDISSPELDDVRVKTKYKMARDLVSSNYQNRIISFSFQVKGTSQAAIVASINKIYAMLARSQSGQYLGGGMYSGYYGYGADASVAQQQGAETGENGLVFKIKFGSTNNADIVTEISATAKTDDRTFTFRVVSGRQSVENMFAAQGLAQLGTSSYVMQSIKLELECEPLATGRARSISVSPVTVISNGTSVISVAGSSIPGSNEALTRIAVDTTASGILIARDVGTSIWNGPAASIGNTTPPSVEKRFIVVGGPAASYSMSPPVSVTVVTANPANLTVNGVTYDAAISTLVPFVEYDISGASGYKFFVTTTNFTGAGSTITTVLHQALISASGTADLYGSSATASSIEGMLLTKFGVLAQPGVTGKYKLLLCVIGAGATNSYELRAVLNKSTSPSIDIGWSKVPARFVSGTSTSYWMAELAVLDFGASHGYGMGHPVSHKLASVDVYVRAINVPVTGDTVASTYAVLIPCADANAYYRAGWPLTNEGIEVFSNFDPSNPYAARSQADYRTTSTYRNRMDSLEETYEGDIITLVPGVTNTLLVAPLLGLADPSAGVPDQDFRTKIIHASALNTSISLAIKPRYLLVG